MKVTSFKAILTLGIVSLMPAIAQAGTSGGHYSVELNKTSTNRRQLARHFIL